MTTTDVLLGIDVGTTTCKAGVVDLGGRERALARRATPWETDGERTEADPLALADAALDAAGEALDEAARTHGATPTVRGVGVASMAESGALVDATGRPTTRVIAWHDPRGSAQVTAIAESLGEEAFIRRTGARLSTTRTIAKLAWRRDAGCALGPGLRWRHVAELVVARLGGEPAAERSLASRTGLLDVDRAEWWDEAREWLGADAALLPHLAAAGTPMGRGDGACLPATRGAVLTVAGHDHLVAQLGAGATDEAALFNSCGTAEAFVRAVEPARASAVAGDAVAAGLASSWHVVPGRRSLLAGVRTGWGLDRVRALLGVPMADTPRLDEGALACTDLGGVRIGGLTSGALTVSGSPAAPGCVWRAALETAAAEAAARKATLERFAGPSASLVAAGGWLRSRAYAEIKRRLLGDFRTPPVTEAGVRGAALLAGVAAGAFGSADALPPPSAS